MKMSRVCTMNVTYDQITLLFILTLTWSCCRLNKQEYKIQQYYDNVMEEDTVQYISL